MKETSNYWHDPEITSLPLLLPTPESGQLSRTMTQVCSPFFMKWPSNQNAIRVLLLLLLSRFSRVQLCATTETAAHQAPLSLGFSRQGYWSALPFPSPMHESESEVAQLCLTLSDPMDCSPPGSSIHGMCQASVLEFSLEKKTK